METESSFNLFRFLEELLIPLVEFIGLDASWAGNILVIGFYLALIWFVVAILAVLLWPIRALWYWLDRRAKEGEGGGCCFVYFIILLTPIPFVPIFMSLSSS